MAEFLRFVADRQLSVLQPPAPFWHALVEELRSTRLLALCPIGVVGAIGCCRATGPMARLAAGVPLENAFGRPRRRSPPSFANRRVGGTGAAVCRSAADSRAQATSWMPSCTGRRGRGRRAAIAGVCLARGYLGRPDLTPKLCARSFRRARSSRLYRPVTCGYLHAARSSTGRIDHQVRCADSASSWANRAALALHSRVRQGVWWRGRSQEAQALVAYLTVVEGHHQQWRSCEVG